MKILDEILPNEQPNDQNSFNSEEEIDIGKSNYEQKLHNEDIYILYIIPSI